MKDLVQCRKLEAKFRQLAVSDPARRFLWLAEAEKWECEAEAEIASHFEARNANANDRCNRANHHKI
jgi:hypothetical protein